MEKSVEWLAGETEVLGENLPQCRFVHPTCCPYANPGRPGGKPASNRWATVRSIGLTYLNKKPSGQGEGLINVDGDYFFSNKKNSGDCREDING
jgi:hypothetical protein